MCFTIYDVRKLVKLLDCEHFNYENCAGMVPCRKFLVLQFSKLLKRFPRPSDSDNCEKGFCTFHGSIKLILGWFIRPGAASIGALCNTIISLKNSLIAYLKLCCWTIYFQLCLRNILVTYSKYTILNSADKYEWWIYSAFIIVIMISGSYHTVTQLHSRVCSSKYITYLITSVLL